MRKLSRLLNWLFNSSSVDNSQWFLGNSLDLCLSPFSITNTLMSTYAIFHSIPLDYELRERESSLFFLVPSTVPATQCSNHICYMHKWKHTPNIITLINKISTRSHLACKILLPINCRMFFIVYIKLNILIFVVSLWASFSARTLFS